MKGFVGFLVGASAIVLLFSGLYVDQAGGRDWNQLLIFASGVLAGGWSVATLRKSA